MPVSLLNNTSFSTFNVFFICVLVKIAKKITMLENELEETESRAENSEE